MTNPVPIKVTNTTIDYHKKGILPNIAKNLELFFVKYKEKFVFIHIVFFILFLAIIVLPLFLPEPKENATIYNNFTKFANYAMWGLWFPLVFLSVIFTGRSWCGILCPMGAASEWANKKGFKLAIPKWVRWEGTPIVSFLIITILGQTTGVRDHPEAMAIIFGSTLLAAILLGFFFGRKKRAWCRHMCPIGLLLGVFSRLGAVEFSAKNKREGGDKYTEKTVCPTMIDIKHKEESRHCIECFRCVVPKSRGGLFLRLRPPGEEIANIKKHNPNIYEVIFLFFGTGTALGGFLWLVLPLYQNFRNTIGEWFINNDMYWIGASGPLWLMAVYPERREVFNWLDFISIVSFMLLTTAFVAIVLSILTAIATKIALRFSANSGFRKSFIELSYQYAPVAMVSLIIGLGGGLFDLLAPFNELLPFITKASFFIIGMIWSMYLGNSILKNLGIKQYKLLINIPSFLGSVFIGWLWWIAIFGV